MSFNIMTITDIIGIITSTLSANFGSLLAIIAIGASVKIIFDIVFTSLYSITTRGR